VTGGTDNHMMVVDTVGSYGIDGKVAEETLDRIAITTNKQIIPDDPNPPLRPSGIRLGTPAATSRGLKEPDMMKIAGWIATVGQSAGKSDGYDPETIRRQVRELCLAHPIPSGKVERG